MNKTLALGLAVLAGVGVGAAIFLYPRPGDVPVTPIPEKPDSGLAGVLIDEEARAAYVKASIRVTDLKVEPDKKPDRDEVVPGLLRVSGVVSNSGDQKLDSVFLSIRPQDADGNVISVFEENVAKPLLGPNETRSFKFTIPANPRFSGQFQHALH